MKATIEQMTINSEKVRDRLKSYLKTLAGYPHFDMGQKLNVYLCPDGDFGAFESQSYAICYASTAHKFTEWVQSKIWITDLPFHEFKSHVDSL